jgi:signal transduction histidine kinase
VIVHWLGNLLDALGAKNVALEHTNGELRARDEEISRQNEELQAQTEELAEQNEEIQVQSEELRQQAEELQTQAEQLHLANEELGKRQQLLEKLLKSVRTTDPAGEVLLNICAPLLELFQDSGVALAILQRDHDQMRVVAQAGAATLDRNVIPYTNAFAAFALEHDRPAAINDLQLRPEIIVPQPVGGGVRSVLAAPLRLGGRAVGTVEVYSGSPRGWTQEQFRILEWASAQCSLMMEARELQERLRASNASLDRQVKERTSELQDMVNELEHFSYTITHDLRAPLRAMHGYAAMLTENCHETLDLENREYLRRIATAAARMDRLITDALSYSKAVRQELTMVVVDPLPLLRGMIDSYPVFQPPRATVEVATDIPPVLANEAGLTQCFSNLLENAVKFVPKDRVPHVRIQAETRADVVRLWFVDNGIGIPREMQSRVFVMFQRLSKEFEGTGIGLALVRKVMERMGGNVGLESNGDGGSRFWIELKAGRSCPESSNTPET